jgi:Protein of unknown function (DUF2970)
VKSPRDAVDPAVLAALAEPEASTSAWQTARAVAWSFFGVRRSVDLAGDVQRLNPVHVVIAGVLGAAVFVLFLVLVVKLVLGSGIAA